MRRQHDHPATLRDRFQYTGRAACLVFLAALLFLAMQPVLAAPLERVTLQLKWFHQFQFAGYYAAIEQGFYADEGLDVVIRERDPAYEPIDEVLAGRADYGVTDSGLLLAALRDDPVVLVAQVFQHSPLVLLTRQSDNLRTAYDLAGKRLTMDSSGLTHVPLVAMLRTAFGDLDDVTLQPYRSGPQELIEKDTDAIAGYRTNEPFLFNAQDEPVSIIDPRDYGIDFYGDNLFTSQNELTEHPGRVARMRRATLRGWAYALEHPDKVIELILTRYNSQNRSREHLEFEARETARNILADFVDLGSFQRSRIDKIATTYASLGLAERTDIPDGFFFAPLRDQLSDAERRHLDSRPALRVGATDGQVPLTFLENGVPEGYLNDLFRQIAGLLDLAIEWVPVESYLAGVDALENGDVDLLTNFSAGTRTDRAPLETENVLAIPFVAVGRMDAPPVQGVDDLLDKRLILVDGYQQTRALQQRYPQIATTLVDSIAQAYRLLRNGEGDYYIDNASHAGYFLSQFMMTDLQIRGELPVEEIGELELRYATTPDRPLVHSAVQKALALIDESGVLALKSKWLRATSTEGLASARQLDLTTAERDWLKNNPQIEIGINDRWPPFGFTDTRGDLTGIGVELVSALNRRLDGALVLKPGEWQKLYDAVADKQLAALLDLTPLPSREGTFNFTQPYVEIPHVFVVRKDGEKITSETDLYGKTVALETGFGNVTYFEERHPAVEIRTYPDTASALEAVSRGEVTAYAGNRAVVSYLLRENVLLDLQMQGRLQNEGSVLAIGTQHDDPILRDILQKALDSLTLNERQAIFEKWTIALTTQSERTLELTPLEADWITDNPVVRVALDPGWAPIEYLDGDGQYQGMSLDYLAKLERLLGLRFEPLSGVSWKQAVEAVKNGTADMFASVSVTPQRETYLQFTRPYVEVPIRIFARGDVTYIGRLENLAGKRVAVPNGYAVVDWLRVDYPELELVLVEDPAAGLEQVASGDVFAFIGNAATANYYIERDRLSNVRLAGETPYANRQSMASRLDQPILAGILQKGLDAISQEDHQSIYNRWMSVRFEQQIDYQLLWRLGIVATLILVAFAFWNRRLQREVGQRQQAEQALLDAQHQLEQRVIERTADLEETQGRFRATFEQAAVGIARVAPDGRCLEINETLCRILDYPREALLQTLSQDLTHPDDREKDKTLIAETLRGERDNYQLEKRYRRGDDRFAWVNVTASLIRKADGTPDYFVSVIEDISERKRIEDTLDRFFDQPINLNLIAGLDGKIKRVNESWLEVLGRTANELIGSNFLDLVHPDDREATINELALLESGKTTFYFENRYRHKNGDYRTLAWSANASLGSGLVYAVAMDVTEKRIAEEKLREAAAVFGNTAEGVVITDTDGLIVDVNDAFTAITGYRKEEVVGEDTSLLQSGRHDRSFYMEMWTTLKTTGHWRGEIWNRRKDGTIYPELLTISQVNDTDGEPNGFVGVFADITSIKQTEQQLAHLAHHDALTGLPNRLLFNARLDQSIRHAERNREMLAVIFIDLDRFKNINDSLGHPAGDVMLKEIAERLQRQVRRDDTVARLSGDEFVVLLEAIGNTEHAVLGVEKLMKAFSEPVNVSDSDVRITASMGLSLYPQDGEDPATLLRNADAAMYRAKDDGRNTYQFYTAELTNAAFEHMFLESALRNAVENDEFRLVYQPQIDLTSGRFTGVEALLRWDHPQQGVIAPGRFIPIAEQSGLIKEIGRWVIAEACRQAKQWHDDGITFGRMAINVAGPQIQQPIFADIVLETLAKTGLRPTHLELEITESFVTHRTEASIDQLTRLREMGIEIAIDDFGTGYSSLSYLKQLPIDKLKIDQAFVRDIPHDPNDMAIAEAVIAMGKALGLKVIAEGVETEEQAKFLRQKGCEFAQGYHFSKPLPPDEIMKLHTRRRASA